jgi:glutathione S-transferase
MSELTLYELPPSPNNVKVRIGLGFKGLQFERSILELDAFPGDRSGIVAVSGQPRTPVLKHASAVIFDSGAILRYLEANFRDTPPLFSTDFDEFGEIERWEAFGRSRLSEPVSIMFQEAFAPQKSADNIRRANELMGELVGQIEDRLSRTGFLVGERLTAADVTAAPMVNLAMLSADADLGPIGQFFAESLRLGKGCDRTREWVRAVLAHDPIAK